MMNRSIGTLIAIVLALLLAAVQPQAPDQNVVIPDICKSLTPDDWFWWWWHSCGKDAGGGGGSGAG